MKRDSAYELVVGLEVHAQLLTNSKLFSGDANLFGSEPNTHVSPIVLGHPGTLPKMNKEAIGHAIKMGLVCNSKIARTNYFARKNYFYPDLPKGYQISQHTTPICIGGYIMIKTAEGDKPIRLTRIHLEEDAGKSIHDVAEDFTCLDYNRAGVPLVEIVTEPDIRSSEEAFTFLTELRKLVRWIGVCDGNMEEGSLRCDANISLRLKGSTMLGTKVEVKNLNSIRNVRKAIEIEALRIEKLLEQGKAITQETRGFDADKEFTYSIRTKEDADDYRYFPDPDLTPFIVTDKDIEIYREALPMLPEQWIRKLVTEFALTDYDAGILTEDKELLDYFLSIAAVSPHFKAIVNWLLGPAKSYVNENGIPFSALGINPERWASMIELVQQDKVSFSAAATKLFPVLLTNKTDDPMQLAADLNLLQTSNVNELELWVDEVLLSMPKKVEEYKKGKKGLIGLFMGEVKKRSKGKADPKRTNDILLSKLN